MVTIEYAVLAAYFGRLNPKNAGEYVELYDLHNWKDKLPAPVYLTGIVEDYAFFLHSLFELRECLESKSIECKGINIIKSIELSFYSIQRVSNYDLSYLQKEIDDLKKGDYSHIKSLFKGKYYFPLNELGVDSNSAFCMMDDDPGKLEDNFKWCAAFSSTDIGII